jgi:hypothetical protein
MKKTDFLEQIELRLEENRRVLVSSPVPEWLQPIAAYLGFHTFRVLLGLSFVITVTVYGFFYDELAVISGLLFGVALK